jgi:hypothetical protein
MLETPILWRNDSEGRPVVAFIISEGEVFGLDANVYAGLQPLADKILELDWAKQAISRKFIGEAALLWLRSSFRAKEQVSLSSALSSASRDKVRPLDVWAPIAYLEVEGPFEFGSGVHFHVRRRSLVMHADHPVDHPCPSGFDPLFLPLPVRKPHPCGSPQKAK